MDADEERREEDEAGDEGHPVVGDAVFDEGESDAFGFAAGEDEGGGEGGDEDFGGGPAFEVADDEAPDHAEGDAVEEEGEGFEVRREDGEEEECEPGDEDGGCQVETEAVARGFRADAGAEVFGEAVAEELGEEEEGFGFEGAVEEADAGDVRVGEDGDGPAEGIHAEVCAECGE